MGVIGLKSFFGEQAGVIRDRAFLVLLLANLTSPLGPALVSPLLDTLTGVFAVSEAEIGLMVSAYTAPGIVVIPIVGILADKYGRKPLLTTGLLLFGASGTALTLTTDFRIVIALRLLQGIGGAAIVPVIITSIGDLYTGAVEATAQGLRLSTSGLSQAIFPVIAGVIVAFAWQYPLLLYGIAIPIAVVIIGFLDEPLTHEKPTTSAKTDPDEKSAGSSGMQSPQTEAVSSSANDTDPIEGESASGQESTNKSNRLRDLARHPPVLAVLLGRGIPGFCYFGFITYNSIIVVQVLDGTPVEAGVLVTLGSIAYAVAASQAGRITASFSSRVQPMVTMFTAIGIGLGLIAVAPTVSIGAVGVLILGIGFGTLGSLYRSVITGLAPGQLRGGLVSISESIGRIGITIAPIVMGVLIAILRSHVGLTMAIRLTLVTVALIGAVAGISLVFLGDVDPRSPRTPA